jgi:hypothetical protein
MTLSYLAPSLARLRAGEGRGGGRVRFTWTPTHTFIFASSPNAVIPDGNLSAGFFANNPSISR